MENLCRFRATIRLSPSTIRASRQRKAGPCNPILMRKPPHGSSLAGYNAGEIHEQVGGRMVKTLGMLLRFRRGRYLYTLKAGGCWTCFRKVDAGALRRPANCHDLSVTTEHESFPRGDFQVKAGTQALHSPLDPGSSPGRRLAPIGRRHFETLSPCRPGNNDRQGRRSLPGKRASARADE
jgi:hypothetical protein